MAKTSSLRANDVFMQENRQRPIKRTQHLTDAARIDTRSFRVTGKALFAAERCIENNLWADFLDGELAALQPPDQSKWDAPLKKLLLAQ